MNISSKSTESRCDDLGMPLQFCLTFLTKAKRMSSQFKSLQVRHQKVLRLAREILEGRIGIIAPLATPQFRAKQRFASPLPCSFPN